MEVKDISLKEVSLWALFFILIFSPILGAGYYSDDILDSLIKGDLKFYNAGLFDYIIDTAWHWIRHSGRISIAHAVYSSVHYFFDTQLSYQIARSVMMFCSILVFAWLLSLITKKSKWSDFIVNHSRLLVYTIFLRLSD